MFWVDQHYLKSFDITSFISYVRLQGAAEQLSLLACSCAAGQNCAIYAISLFIPFSC